ncbi:MAG: 30S ribosomal protein S21 [Verrucomicrobia bacterium]|nr:30S ribosomal protein S21 [Verrucomicrobiota bacterium]
MVSEVKVRRGETVDRALRRLKKKLDKEGVMREIRSHRHYEKPSERKRRKAARARTRF